jgi:3-oxoacyl-[acyl-carrier protein] reductase
MTSWLSNLKGAFFCCRAVIPVMRSRDGGQIVNVSSISGFTGQGSCIAYAASKAALINMTRALAVSQAPHIRVNAVAPGVVETRWISGMENFTDQHRRATPLKRVAYPEDVAIAIFGLVINEFITGHTVVVDGGRML